MCDIHDTPNAIHEQFRGPHLHPDLQWFCPPPSVHLHSQPPCLELATSPATDFWQRTHYGFQADNGHFLYARIEGDFVLSTDVEFHGLHQYDQAGLMVRHSADCWLKTSVEFEPHSPNRLGAVVTRHGYSDWSTQDVPKELHRLQLRIHREGSSFRVEARFPGDAFTQLRLAHLDAPGPLQVGLYACSPKEAGFRPRFHALHLEPR